MRSFLFVPADSERKLAKGPASGPDGLILDLEDSVATDRKKVARDMALAYLKSASRTGPKLYLDALGKHGSLCPTTGGDPLKPHQLPEGWAAHPQQLKDFLCAGSK